MMRRKSFVAVCALLATLCAASAVWAAKVEVRATRRLLPTVLYLVGTYDGDGNPDVCTVDRDGIAETFGSGYYYLGLHNERQTAKNIDATGVFTINVPTSAMMAQAEFLGQATASSGARYLNKLKAAGMRFEKASKVNAPMLTDCPVVLECSVVATEKLPDVPHIVYIGKVTAIHIDEASLTNPEAKTPSHAYSATQADPLLYHAGAGKRAGYYKISEKLGSRYGVWGDAFPKADLKRPARKSH